MMTKSQIIRELGDVASSKNLEASDQEVGTAKQLLKRALKELPCKSRAWVPKVLESNVQVQH